MSTSSSERWKGRWRDLFLFAGAGTALLLMLWSVSELTDPVYPELRAAWKALYALEGEALAVSIGSSHAADAMDFGQLPFTGTAFTAGGRDLFESVFLMSSALRTRPDLEAVFVSVSPGSLHLDNGLTAERQGRRRELYARTPGNRWIQGDFLHFVAAQASPIARPDHWKHVATHLLGREPAYGPPAPGVMTPALLEEHAVVHAAAAQDLMESMMSIDTTIPERALRELRRAAELADERGVLLILYTAPVAPAFLNRLPAGLADDLARSVSAIAAASACTQYHDFLSEPAITLHPSYFRDSNHLSRTGAAVFSGMMAARIAAPARGCVAS